VGDACFELTCTALESTASTADVDSLPFSICLPEDGHADGCATDVDCQRGDYCHGGGCTVDDRAGCDICSPCASDADCTGRGRCIGVLDDGVGECVQACGDVDGCPGDSVCREIAGANDETVAVCLSPRGGSAAEDRCDPSYTCTVACRDDVPCPRGEACVGGACAAPPATPATGCACGATASGTTWAAALAVLLRLLTRRQRRRR
jgi:MYXO-CTERM domain-containing protein